MKGGSQDEREARAEEAIELAKGVAPDKGSLMDSIKAAGKGGYKMLMFSIVSAALSISAGAVAGIATMPGLTPAQKMDKVLNACGKEGQRLRKLYDNLPAPQKNAINAAVLGMLLFCVAYKVGPAIVKALKKKNATPNEQSDEVRQVVDNTPTGGDTQPVTVSPDADSKGGD